MENNQIPFYARLLFVIGIGVALAVALDNIAIGVGVAAAFYAAFIARRHKFRGISGKNDE